MSSHILAQVAAVGAMGFALVVALVDRPRGHQVAPITWPATIETGADHITTNELAELLLADPRSVLIVDVRPSAEFVGFHLPGAVNLDIVELLGARGEELLAAQGERFVVLCSNGMTHPAQAWVELTRRGHTNVRVLEDGLDGFVRDVLTPPSLRGVTTEARATREHPTFAAASAAFLVRPHASTTQAPGAAPSVQQSETRGTGLLGIARLATDPAALTTPTIVSTAWVAKHGAALVLLDAREKPEEFAAGHIAGARHVPIKALREVRDGVPEQLLSVDKLVTLLGQLGIDNETQVVAYGDVKLQDPAHVALALISVGHKRIAIMEGGLPAWRAEGRALSPEVAMVASKTYVSKPASDLRAVVLEEVRAASTDPAARILDVRPADAFRGEVSTEARAGHIPHSLNRPYTSDVASTAAGVFWRPLEDLRREYEAMGFSRTEPVIVSCRTGHQAAQTWFTLRYVLGYEDVRWYDGSWTEWASRPELPVETGAVGN